MLKLKTIQNELRVERVEDLLETVRELAKKEGKSRRFAGNILDVLIEYAGPTGVHMQNADKYLKRLLN